MTTVVQGAQTRVFKTDSLGRTVYASEPERGVTTYSYAYSATAGLGLTVTRTRPQANQTNPAVLTTTTTQYDSVGRVVGVTYTDGTPAKTFAYDTNAWVWSNFSPTNLKGRMYLAYSPQPEAATTFSYDAMGRINEMAECTPSGCGNGAYDKHVSYQYDWAGNLTGSALSGVNGGGVATGYAYSAANEVTTITSSPSDATHPGTLLSNVVNGPNGPISYALGNGLTVFRQFNYRQQPTGQWLCSGVTNEGCVGGTQIYGNYWQQYGSQIQLDVDTDSIQSQEIKYGYDQLNRLASRTVTEGTAQNFAYAYDRYGNRASQTVTAGSGPQPGFNFNPANNRIVGYTYDAAGNMTNDGSHGYAYDAEGNITQVDGGSTAKYAYDALNRRVRADVGASAVEYVFDQAGRRAGEWDGHSLAQLRGHYYWGGTPLAYYTTSPAATHFEHQDYLGNERVRTSYAGAVEGTFAALPFGDGAASSGADTDPHHFAGLDHDAEDSTEHAQFRNYSSAQGRWLAPDPYDGSYDITNPQSLNRYAYALNNPLTFRDPSGLVLCDWGSSDDGGEDFDDDEDCAADGGTVVQDLQNVVVNGDGGTGDYSSWLSDGTVSTLIEYIPGVGTNKPTPAPAICGGTFTFAGKEIDAGEGGAFIGAITEHDSVNGNSVASLNEAWVGGEGPVVGVGSIGSPGSPGSSGIFFAGLGLSGILAGIQVGYVGGSSFGGLYIEGHLGPVAVGTGGYLTTGSCKK